MSSSDERPTIDVSNDHAERKWQSEPMEGRPTRRFAFDPYPAIIRGKQVSLPQWKRIHKIFYETPDIGKSVTLNKNVINTSAYDGVRWTWYNYIPEGTECRIVHMWHNNHMYSDWFDAYSENKRSEGYVVKLIHNGKLYECVIVLREDITPTEGVTLDQEWHWGPKAYRRNRVLK